MNGTFNGLKQNMERLNIGRIQQVGTRTCESCQGQVPVMERTDRDGVVHEESLCIACDTQKLKSKAPKAEDVKFEKIKRFGEKHQKVPGKLIGKTVAKYVPENDSEKAMKEAIVDYVRNFGNTAHHSLVLKGPMGLGKSHLAYAASSEIRRRGYSVMYIAADDFLSLIKSTFDKKSELTESKIFEMIEQLDLVVFDEIGAEYLNKKDEFESWASEKILKVTDLREDKPTIYTTNYSAPEMEKKYGSIQGGRITSRMMAGAKRILVEGRDRREELF
ncbi:ATP-binding protein [Pontibacillus salipaludis]|uniref:AAA+ ATPase domain-containing protein n=1 Tax=Pontibacillus salipaludis TaxID=1697394 RepID=A0ABQ1PVK5_9BACI|nr:ATP-binding protein [Pontibacillus salipaludis]GGD05176.1 hypothetical protein GCM10011389_10840 [Pontibacillus salipaludis]